MGKRDVVLLAVVMNAAVLALLFVLASTSDTISVSIPAFSYEPVEEVQMVKNHAPLSILKDNEVVAAVEKTSSLGVEEVIQDFVASMQSEPSAAVDFKPRIRPQSEEIDSFSSVPMVEVKVESGDVLGKIALRYQTTVAEIKRANHLQSDHLRAGQVLKVPLGTKTSEFSTASSNDDLSSNEYYVIESGDNPWKIAKKFQVSVFELLRLNGLDESKAKNLRPGDKIRVR